MPHTAGSKADLVDTDADRLAKADEFPCRGVFGLSGPGSVSKKPAEGSTTRSAKVGNSGVGSTATSDETSTSASEEPTTEMELAPAAVETLALVLEFSLPKSCYATMMLREACHTPTHAGSFLS